MYVNSFSGEVVCKWPEDEERNMVLVEPISFTSTNQLWTVPAGAVFNGASIPQILWSIMGSPFVGKYRRAAVFHDYYCTIKNRPYKDVHKMFYEAMLCDEVNAGKALAMYYGVLEFGPKWGKELEENNDTEPYIYF